MKKAAVVVMGNTKGTAWQIFQIVCKGWANFVEDDLQTGVNYDDLNRYQWGGDSLLDTRARKVLAWGLRLLEQGTFERGDYMQLLILTAVHCGLAWQERTCGELQTRQAWHPSLCKVLININVITSGEFSYSGITIKFLGLLHRTDT